jgi:phospholipid/cholesterol/gamma-HCH transport system substrate-binding protein
VNKQAPSRGKLLTMVAFAASCIGLLIFLWTSFGGSIPFAPKGYRFNIEFDQAVQLAQQSDVRISGVSVGKVVSVRLDHNTGLTHAVLELDRKYAPRPTDTRAILRSKSLLGETYIELSPGSQHAPALPDGGTLPHSQVAPTVALDQILSTFDAPTRRAFQVWMQSQGIALTKRGEDFNAGLYQLFPFAVNVDSVLAVLNRDSVATSQLLREGGITFSALSASPAQLQGFITNSNNLFAATARQNAALAATVRAFPAFTVAVQSTVEQTTKFANNAKPLIDELRPATRELTPALQRLVVLAPELRDLMVNIGPLTEASKTGVPAFEKFLDQTVPLLTRLKPYLGGIVPILNYINSYRREVAAFFANGTAATQATLPNGEGVPLHYARVSNPVNPEVLSAYQSRLTSNRGNPYLAPGGYEQLLRGLPVFGGYLCTSNPQPTIGPTITADLQKLLQEVYYTARPGGPPCRAQAPLGSLTTGQLQAFPHLNPLP